MYGFPGPPKYAYESALKIAGAGDMPLEERSALLNHP
jgi:hypothetical protein